MKVRLISEDSLFEPRYLVGTEFWVSQRLPNAYLASDDEGNFIMLYPDEVEEIDDAS